MEEEEKEEAGEGEGEQHREEGHVEEWKPHSRGGGEEGRSGARIEGMLLRTSICRIRCPLNMRNPYFLGRRCLKH